MSDKQVNGTTETNKPEKNKTNKKRLNGRNVADNMLKSKAASRGSVSLARR